MDSDAQSEETVRKYKAKTTNFMRFTCYKNINGKRSVCTQPHSEKSINQGWLIN